MPTAPSSGVGRQIDRAAMLSPYAGKHLRFSISKGKGRNEKYLLASRQYDMKYDAAKQQLALSTPAAAGGQACGPRKTGVGYELVGACQFGHVLWDPNDTTQSADDSAAVADLEQGISNIVTSIGAPNGTFMTVTDTMAVGALILPNPSGYTDDRVRPAIVFGSDGTFDGVAISSDSLLVALTNTYSGSSLTSVDVVVSFPNDEYLEYGFEFDASSCGGEWNPCMVITPDGQAAMTSNCWDKALDFGGKAVLFAVKVAGTAVLALPEEVGLAAIESPVLAGTGTSEYVFNMAVKAKALPTVIRAGSSLISGVLSWTGWTAMRDASAAFWNAGCP